MSHHRVMSTSSLGKSPHRGQSCAFLQSVNASGLRQQPSKPRKSEPTEEDSLDIEGTRSTLTPFLYPLTMPAHSVLLICGLILLLALAAPGFIVGEREKPLEKRVTLANLMKRNSLCDDNDRPCAKGHCCVQDSPFGDSSVTFMVCKPC